MLVFFHLITQLAFSTSDPCPIPESGAKACKGGFECPHLHDSDTFHIKCYNFKNCINYSRPVIIKRKNESVARMSMFIIVSIIHLEIYMHNSYLSLPYFQMTILSVCNLYRNILLMIHQNTHKSFLS